MSNYLSFAILWGKSLLSILGKIFIGDISSVSRTIDIKYNLQKKDSQFQYTEYETKRSKYKIWIDILDKLKLNNFWSSIVTAVLVYLIGLLLSLFIGFTNNYLNTLAIYLISFGIFITTFTLRISSNRIHESMLTLRPCFMVSDNEYFYFLDTWFKRLSNNRIIIFITLIFTAILGVLLYCKFYNESIYNQLNLLSLELTSFKINGWYDQPNLDSKFLLMGYFIIITSSLLITSFRILFINFFFIIDLLKLPIIPIPNLIRLRIENLSGLYLMVSFNWFVGVSLFGILLFTSLDWLSISILTLISLVGFITFMAPQYLYSKMLYKSQQISTHWIFSSFYKKMNIDLNEKNLANIISSQRASNLYQLNSLSDFFEASKPVKRNIYSITQLLFFFTGQLLSITSPILRNWITITLKNFS